MYSWRFASSVPTGVGQPSASCLSLRNVLMYWANKLVEVCGKCQISWILSMSYPWVKASGALACTKCRSGRRRLRNDCNGGYTARTACQVLPQHNFCTREKAIFPGSGRVERTSTSHRVAVLCTSRGQSKETGLNVSRGSRWSTRPNPWISSRYALSRFHSHSHMVWREYPDWRMARSHAWVRWYRSSMVCLSCIRIWAWRFGKQVGHPWKKHPWNSHTVRLTALYRSTQRGLLAIRRVYSPLFLACWIWSASMNGCSYSG